MDKWVNELFFIIRILRFTHKYNPCLVVYLINRIIRLICLYRFYDIFEGYMVEWSAQFNIESFIWKIHIVATLWSFFVSHLKCLQDRLTLIVHLSGRFATDREHLNDECGRMLLSCILWKRCNCVIKFTSAYTLKFILLQINRVLRRVAPT